MQSPNTTQSGCGAWQTLLFGSFRQKITNKLFRAPRSSPPERFWGVEHGSALGRAPFLRVERALRGFVVPSSGVVGGGGDGRWP